MQCLQCQHENRAGANFCDQCGTRIVHVCPNCGHQGRCQAKYCDQCGTSLTDGTSAPRAARPDEESRFHALLRAVMGLLQRERRITYRELKHVFAIDDLLVEEIREELALKGLAKDEASKVLIWTAASHTATSFAKPESEPLSNEPAALATIDTDVLHDEPAVEITRVAPEAERRQLTVMFCDLADSTQLSQQLDPEELREVIRAYQETAAEVIHQYEGHMAQYLGDGLLIYFGWPIAHEDDAQRAAHAGLGIVEAITTSLNPHLEQEKGAQLTVRLGIHTGPVVVGEMGGGGRHENLATGETVNIAARLEGLAAPNTVVISSVTERLVRRAFELEDLGPLVLKGVAEPMDVFRVTRPLDTERDDEENLPGESVFLVGRDEEVGLLLRRWEQTKEGLGQAALINGEAGIGKSFLVEALHRHVHAEGLPRITFRCSPYHQNSALYPVITHIEHLSQFERQDSPAVKLHKLEQVLQMYSLPLQDVVPLFAALLSIAIPEERYPALQLTPQQQKQQTLDALVGWLLEEAERQPVLVVWEDLHWADASTLELLGMVLEQSPTVSMLSVLTYRPLFEPPWPARSHMTPITLNRLERPQVEALIMHLARGKRLPPEVVAHIVSKTDGVPLFVEELTKMLLESDLLDVGEGRDELSGSLSTVTIPATLQDSLMARLDRLPSGREVAQLGSVIGREFSHELLGAVAGMEAATLQAGLSQLVAAEILYRRGRPPRATYIFKHALIQDAAYESMLKSTRQQHHQRIARILAQRFPEIAEHQPELLAHHFTVARLPEQAIGYWHKAGQRAVERSANTEAITHLSTGVEMLNTQPEAPERDQKELELMIALGPPLIAIKGYVSLEVEEVYNRAYELCRHVGKAEQRFSVLTGLRRFYQVRGELARACEIGEHLLALAQQRQDPTLLLEAYWSLAGALFHLGKLVRVQQYLEQAVVIYKTQEPASRAIRHGTIPGIHCLGWLSRTLWMRGYADQALQRMHEALTLARQHNVPFTLGFTMGVAHQLRCDRREWSLILEDAESFSTLQTTQLYQNMLKGYHALASVMQDKAPRGIASVREWLESSDDRQGRPKLLACLAEAHDELGEVEAGLEALAEGFVLVDKMGSYVYEAELHRIKGELLRQANAPQTEACFHRALEVARQQQAKSLELRAATSLARLWQSQGKRQDAYELLEPVYGWFTEGFDTADLKDAKTLLDELS